MFHIFRYWNNEYNFDVTNQFPDSVSTSLLSITHSSIESASAGLETNARPLARGELNSVRASGSSDLTSPVGEWNFNLIFFFLGLLLLFEKR